MVIIALALGALGLAAVALSLSILFDPKNRRGPEEWTILGTGLFCLYLSFRAFSG